MADIVVNGISREGSSVQIVNNKILIDGVDITPGAKDITIEISGDVEILKADACKIINIHGNVGKLNTISGDVVVGGSVDTSVSSTSGDITCSEVGGSVNTTSGDVKVIGGVSGSIKTSSGDVINT